MSRPEKLTFKESIAKKALYDFLKKLLKGQLKIIEDNSNITFFGEENSHYKTGEITVTDPKTYTAIVFGGDIGLAESYIAGFWTTSDLTALLTVLALNANMMFNFSRNKKWSKKLRAYLWNKQKRNTKLQAKLNILAHYDLSNDLFKCFLDTHMMYSCALYPTPNSTLAEAQQHRLKTICDKLSLQATDHIVEIGSGWGGFAIYAAQHYGCRVTTTTISEQQYQECKLRIKKLGLSDRIRLLKEDYRNLQGKYDKLVSLEMIEAVGPQYYDHFFKKCSALLKDDGIMLLQCITTVDQRYQKVIKDVDFIKRYIFPGGHLPSMTIMQNTITRETDLNLIDLHDITPHYAITLKDWRHTFNQNTSAIENLGFDESFKRLWNFYFCYCEAGFLVRTINVIQCVFVKPQWQFSSLLRIGYGN